jgi:hypothetical protein
MTVGENRSGPVDIDTVSLVYGYLHDEVLIRSRSEWGADLPPTGELLPEPDVRFLLVHHTAGRTDYAESEVVEQIRQSYRHQTGPARNWPDVCYNFFVDRYGGIWEGRHGSATAAVMADATGGSQGFAQLVCLIGNFHENRPTPAMMASLERLLAHLIVQYGLDSAPGATTSFVSRGSNKWPEGTRVTARVISGHRDVSDTVCPGDFLYPLLESDVPRNVLALLRA